MFDDGFAKIMADPFTDLGFKSFTHANPTDKTFYPLTFKSAKEIVAILSNTDCADHEHCDSKLREIHSEAYSGRAHLFVDLRAPKQLLKEQFEKWLDTSLVKRKRGPAISDAVIQRWAVNHPILPYQDLWLWHKRHDLEMPSDFIMAEWLQINARNAARETKEKAPTAFSIETYDNLKFSASAENNFPSS